MVRGGWCEKMGLKKGAWSGEEDEILISYIQAHGHSNWRALPKLAGWLLRCGKSCRLRWTNYLRPDIKRGNFSAEEEHTIFNLHQILGNRWSAIAARLPGRTDNEIKNVWHTHLKKRLPLPPQSQHNHNNITPKLQIHSSKSKSKTTHPLIKLQTTTVSPPQSQSSSDTDLTTTNVGRTSEHNNIDQALDEDFWSEVLSADDSPSQIPHFQFSTPTVCHGFSFDFCFHAGLRD